MCPNCLHFPKPIFYLKAFFFEFLPWIPLDHHYCLIIRKTIARCSLQDLVQLRLYQYILYLHLPQAEVDSSINFVPSNFIGFINLEKLFHFQQICKQLTTHTIHNTLAHFTKSFMIESLDNVATIEHTKKFKKL